MFVEPSAADLTALATLADQGRLTVHVDREIPLADAEKAHELAASGGAKGKTVLVPGPGSAPDVRH